MRLNNDKYSLNRNLQNINTSYSPNNYSKERTIYSQSTKNIFSSKNPMYSTNENTYNSSRINSPYKQRNPNIISDKTYTTNNNNHNYNLSNSPSLNNISGISQINGGNSYYQRKCSCNCNCHCELCCCQDLINDCGINCECNKIYIQKLIRDKEFLIEENGKLKKHILILTDQNQSLINELDVIVSSSECCTIDINHNGINHLNNVISDNKCRLEKSLDDLEKTINQRKIELN